MLKNKKKEVGGILSGAGDTIQVELYAYVEYTNPLRPKFGFVYLSLCARVLPASILRF